MPQQPSLIVVTGRPGAGKTTLAHALARSVRCPAICRDAIKEGFMQAAVAGVDGPSADDVARHVYDVFFETIELLLRRGVTVVAEAAFQHKRWAPKLQPLREIARVRIIVCTVDAQLARARDVKRRAADADWERFHGPAERGEVPDYDPPRLDVPTMMVDTTDGYRPALDAIVSFARG